MKYSLLLMTLFSFSASAQTIDTSPLDAYWKMTEPLKKGDSLSQTGCRFKDFELDQADSIVQQADSSLLTMATSGGKIFKTEKEYRELIRWSGGHCPGYYIADIIVRNGLRKQLLEHIQNPFSFIYLYNRAAKTNVKKPPLFSPASISYIQSLEKNTGLPIKNSNIYEQLFKLVWDKNI